MPLLVVATAPNISTAPAPLQRRSALPCWSYDTPPESATIVSIPVDELREATKIVIFQTLRIYLVIFVSRTDKIENPVI
jgi:hypothetical protein